MMRIIKAAKTETSDAFKDAFDELDDDLSYALSGIEAVSRKNEAAARDIVNRFEEMVQSILAEIANEF